MSQAYRSSEAHIPEPGKEHKSHGGVKKFMRKIGLGKSKSGSRGSTPMSGNSTSSTPRGIDETSAPAASTVSPRRGGGPDAQGPSGPRDPVPTGWQAVAAGISCTFCIGVGVGRGLES